MMSRTKLLTPLSLVLVFALALSGSGGMVASAQSPAGAAFTYQGQLRESGTPYTGSCDFELRLYDALTGGSQIGSTQTVSAVAVSDGLFSVLVDFGAASYNGDKRYLEGAVKCGADSGFTTLSPRQELTAAPYATYALTAPWAGLWNVPAGFADGVDDEGASYTAGPGLTLTGSEFAADTDYLQRRVSGFCPDYAAIRTIAADGSVTCRDTISGLDQTDTIAVNAPFPLGSGDWSLDVKASSIGATEIISTEVQARVSGTCTAGQSIRVIAADGSVTCEADDNSGGDVTAVSAGSGLSGGGSSGDLTLSVNTATIQARVSGSCTAGQSIRVIAADGSVTCTGPLWARVYNSAGYTLSHNTWTVLTFNSERWDTDTIHSTSSNTSRLTATTAGVYIITGQAQYNASGTGTRALAIKLNAAGSSASGSWLAFGSTAGHAADPIHVELTTQYYLAAGDYVELFGWQNSGGNLAIGQSASNWPEFSMTLQR